MMLNFSCSTFTTGGVRNSGSVGPSLMFLTPRCSSERSMHTAFCSYHDSTRDRGSPLMSAPKALASSMAITTAE
ncbi:MAG: hypothetical protein BWY92_01835 [Firmicutes bacterium ADurb.BinA052]|nr:MAG: hypothetical protein BWY92_01835 [Firmicutes bacterium ADurb.BinA052]